MQTINDILTHISGFLWGWPMIILLLVKVKSLLLLALKVSEVILTELVLMVN